MTDYYCPQFIKNYFATEREAAHLGRPAVLKWIEQIRPRLVIGDRVEVIGKDDEWYWWSFTGPVN